MTISDVFTVYLHHLDAAEIEFEAISDGRHILHITRDISLYVRPGTDDLAAVTAGLRKLAESAGAMAEALETGQRAAS